MENLVQQPDGQKNILEDLRSQVPGRDPVFTAFDQLTDETSIRVFFQQYIDSLRQRFGEQAEEVARLNVGYTIGYYDKATADRWFKALPNVSHPIFGRNYPVQ